MTLSISGCGCVSDPASKVHAPCARPSHTLAYGYERGFAAPCADCGRVLLYPSWGREVKEPCCPRCIGIRYEREAAVELDAYYERVVENVRTLARVRHEPRVEVVDLAFACTEIGRADIDPLSDFTAQERLYVLRRAAQHDRDDCECTAVMAPRDRAQVNALHAPTCTMFDPQGQDR